MKRECACGCGHPLVGRADKQYATEACRKRLARRTAGPRPADATDAAESSGIADALRAELIELGVVSTFEAVTALRLAAQLDSGAYMGAQFVSLSKELDRRVEVLRLRGERPDDPVTAVRRQLEAHKLRLVEGEGA